MGFSRKVAPPGWEAPIEKMAAEKVENPQALAWHMKTRGFQPDHKAISEFANFKNTIDEVSYRAAAGEAWAQNQLLNANMNGYHIYSEQPW
jgi:hypothetical protein